MRKLIMYLLNGFIEKRFSYLDLIGIGVCGFIIDKLL